VVTTGEVLLAVEIRGTVLLMAVETGGVTGQLALLRLFLLLLNNLQILGGGTTTQTGTNR